MPWLVPAQIAFPTGNTADTVLSNKLYSKSAPSRYIFDWYPSNLQSPSDVPSHIKPSGPLVMQRILETGTPLSLLTSTALSKEYCPGAGRVNSIPMRMSIRYRYMETVCFFYIKYNISHKCSFPPSKIPNVSIEGCPAESLTRFHESPGFPVEWGIQMQVFHGSNQLFLGASTKTSL